MMMRAKLISKKIDQFLWLIYLLLTFSSSAHALVEFPQLQTPVTDLTQTLSPEQTHYLEAKLSQFSREKGSQVAVLIVSTTQPEDVAQFSIRVAEAWKLGREKQDDGAILIVAKNDRKVRLEVGYGLEGAIPDLIAKRIITEIIAPNFRQGDYFGGIDQATTKIMALVDGEQLAPPASRSSNNPSIENLLPLLLIGGFILGGIFRAIFGNFLGGTLNGGAIGFVAWMLGGGIFAAVLFGIVAFFITLMGVSSLGNMGSMGGSGFGGRGSGGFDPFSGGGGGFGGGGASGDW